MENKEEYYPIGCDHQKKNGLTSWSYLSGGTSSGPEIDTEEHVSVCLKCGDIKVSGRQNTTKWFEHIFSIHNPEAIDAIVKQALFLNENKAEEFEVLKLLQSQLLESQKEVEAMKIYAKEKFIKLLDREAEFSEIIDLVNIEITSLKDQLRWRNVAEELPSVLKYVLTKDKSGAERVLQLVDYEGGNDVTGFTTTYAWEDEETGLSFEFEEITHWLPIPQINNK